MHYKDLQNNLHAIDSEQFEYLLPEGSVLITDEEAAEITASRIVPPTYRELRIATYPPAADYLDSVVKGDSVARQKYIDDCLAVKARYPKPVVSR